MGTLFKNGTIITASDMVDADVLVEGEVITLIGQDLDGWTTTMLSIAPANT